MSAYFSLPMYAASSGQRLRLIAGRCKSCGATAYPQRNVCTACGRTHFEETQLSGRGEIFTYTVIARGGAPAEFDDQQTMTGRIACGVVELEEGPRVIVQFADWRDEDLAIGRKVEAVVARLFDQEGVVRYGTKFVPVREGGPA